MSNKKKWWAVSEGYIHCYTKWSDGVKELGIPYLTIQKKLREEAEKVEANRKAGRLLDPGVTFKGITFYNNHPQSMKVPGIDMRVDISKYSEDIVNLIQAIVELTYPSKEHMDIVIAYANKGYEPLSRLRNMLLK